MLHPRVGNDDEKSGEPRADRHEERGCGVEDARYAVPSVEQHAQEYRLERERVHTFEHERGTHDWSRPCGERGPVRAELELHRYAGDDADGKVDGEDLRPKAGGLRVLWFAGLQRAIVVPRDERHDAHRPNRKEIMEHHREGELKPIGQNRVHQLRLYWNLAMALAPAFTWSLASWDH